MTVFGSKLASSIVILAFYANALESWELDPLHEVETFGILTRPRRPHNCDINDCQPASNNDFLELPLIPDQPCAVNAPVIPPATPLVVSAELGSNIDAAAATAVDAIADVVRDVTEPALSGATYGGGSITMPQRTIQLPIVEAPLLRPRPNLALDVERAIIAAREASDNILASATIELPASSAQAVAAAKDAYVDVLHRPAPPIPRIGNLAAAFRNAGQAFMAELPNGRQDPLTTSIIPAFTQAISAFSTTLPPPEWRSFLANFDKAIVDLTTAVDTAWLLALPDAVNAAYGSTVRAIPQTCALADATRAFGLALRASLATCDSSKFFAAISDATAAFAALFPGEPQALVASLAVAEHAFVANLPTEGLAASIIGGLQDGSILPAMAAAARAFDDCAPVHPVSAILSQWFYNLANLNTIDAWAAATAAYREAQATTARAAVEYNLRLRRAATAARRAYVQTRRGVEAMKEGFESMFVDPIQHSFDEYSTEA